MAIFPSLHAIGLRCVNGVECLLHVGLNTVMLNGKYFDMKVEQGQKVSIGDLLLEFDLNGIKKEGYSLVTPVLITNSEEKEIDKLVNEKECVEKGTKIMRIRNKENGSHEK